MESKSPESLDLQKKITPGSIATELLTEIHQAEASRSVMEDNWKRWYEKRMGIRPPKDFPWPGCANIHLPLTDKSIKKLAPLYCSMVDSPGKVAIFRPAPNQPQLIKERGKCETFFTFLVQCMMNSHPEALGISETFALGADKMLEKGFFIAKVVWDTVSRRKSRFLSVDEIGITPGTPDQDIVEFLTTKYPLSYSDDTDRRIIDLAIADIRSGAKTFEIRFSETIYNAPRVIVRDPKDIVTPSDTTSLQTARWIDDKYYMTPNQLRYNKKIGKYNGNVEKFLNSIKADEPQTHSDSSQPTTELDALKQKREGISDTTPQGSKTFLIHELGCYYDIDGDGIDEKCILTFPDANPDLYFRFVEFPYDHGEWPWIDFPFELTDERYTSSRGIPEHLDHLQTILTSQHNFKLDCMTITNAPVLKAVIGGVNSGNISWIPGSTIPVLRPDAIEPIQWDSNPQLTFEREEIGLKAWAEEYIGLIDHTLVNPNAPTQEARTRFEIESVVSERARIFGHNAKIFLRRLRRVYEQIWALWMQYGDRKIEIYNLGEPILVNKAQMEGRWYIIPAASPEAVNPQQELQAAAMDLQLFGNDQSTNQLELRKRYWRARDPLSFEEMVVEPARLSTDQVERQVLEIVQMEKGFDVAIKPDDQDQTHIQVIQQHFQNIAAGKAPADETLLRRLTSHAQFHKARLLQSRGQSGEAEKARTQGNQLMGLTE